jgi:predicted transcriptional regulator
LDDEDCRSIIKALEEPMTANELVNACNISFSTLYRKLDLLTESSLIEEEIVIRTGGQNTTRFVRTFEQLHIEVDADLQMDVLVDPNADR